MLKPGILCKGDGDQNHLLPAPSALLAPTDFYPGSPPPPFFSRVDPAPRTVNGSEGFKLHVTHKAVPKHAKDILIQDRLLFFKLTLISKQNSASHRSSSFAWSAAQKFLGTQGFFYSPTWLPSHRFVHKYRRGDEM